MSDKIYKITSISLPRSTNPPLSGSYSSVPMKKKRKGKKTKNKELKIIKKGKRKGKKKKDEVKEGQS